MTGAAQPTLAGKTRLAQTPRAGSDRSSGSASGCLGQVEHGGQLVDVRISRKVGVHRQVLSVQLANSLCCRLGLVNHEPLGRRWRGRSDAAPRGGNPDQQGQRDRKDEGDGVTG